MARCMSGRHECRHYGVGQRQSVGVGDVHALQVLPIPIGGICRFP